MGEEVMKTEEKKPEEVKTEEQKTEEPKKEETKTKEPKESPPPQEIVLKVHMHCEGCARKVRRCLKGFPGVENVVTDCKAQKVVVKGEKVDPIAVMERVQKKSHRKVELLSPIPKPPSEEPENLEEKMVEKPPEKKEVPQVITVVLGVHMHCEACAQEIRRRILKMNGVEEVEPDLKSSQVTVKGVFDPPKLVEYVHKRTGKHAIIVKEEKDEKKEENVNEEKKADDGGGDKPAEEEKKEGGDGVAPPPPTEGQEEAMGLVELKKNEFYYNYPQNYQINPYPQMNLYPQMNPYQQRYEMHPYPYQPYPAPLMFSDENPNACSVM